MSTSIQPRPADSALQTLRLAPSQAPDRSTVQFVGVGDLKVDRSYQPENRQRQSRIDWLAQNWSDVLAGVLSVSLRDGDLWVFDGATRLGAARENGSVIGLWCKVSIGLSQADEARAFRMLNQWRWAVHVVDRFNAMLIEGDKEARQLQKVLDEYGLKIGYTPSAVEISAVQAVEFVNLWGVLPETLNAITTAWPEDPYARRREILLAIGSFARQYQGIYSEPSFIRMLRQISPKKLVGDASASPSYARGKWGGIAEELQYLYNRAARTGGFRLLHRYDRPKLPRTAVTISKRDNQNMPGDYEARQQKRKRKSAAAASW